MSVSYPIDIIIVKLIICDSVFISALITTNFHNDIFLYHFSILLNKKPRHLIRWQAQIETLGLVVVGLIVPASVFIISPILYRVFYQKDLERVYSQACYFGIIVIYEMFKMWKRF